MAARQSISAPFLNSCSLRPSRTVATSASARLVRWSPLKSLEYVPPGSTGIFASLDMNVSALITAGNVAFASAHLHAANHKVYDSRAYESPRNLTTATPASSRTPYKEGLKRWTLQTPSESEYASLARRLIRWRCKKPVYVYRLHSLPLSSTNGMKHEYEILSNHRRLNSNLMLSIE